MSTVTTTHIHLDPMGVAWIDDTNVKVIEVVVQKLATDPAPRRCTSSIHTFRLLKSMRHFPIIMTTKMPSTPRSASALVQRRLAQQPPTARPGGGCEPQESFREVLISTWMSTFGGP